MATFQGGEGDDRFDGSDGMDSASGGAGNDILLGAGGDDLLASGTGQDLLSGGAGDDRLYFGADLDPLDVVEGGEGRDQLILQGDYSAGLRIGADYVTGIETLRLLSASDATFGGGSSGALFGYDIVLSDGLVTAGETLRIDAALLQAGETLRLDASALTAGSVDIVAGAGDDVLIGGAGADRLAGNRGNDVLDGGAGGDQMQGGAGDDIYYYDHLSDRAYDSASADGGVDTVISSVPATLTTYVENLTLTGEANLTGVGNGLANVITGNAGNNLLNGGAGADTLIGGLGNDTFVYDDLGDRAYDASGAEGGIDTVRSAVSATLTSYVENLVLTGNADLVGVGNALANTIIGNAGNNLLNGAAGADLMVGGAGHDIYLVDDAGDVVVERAGQGFDAVLSSIDYVLGADVEGLLLTGSAAINGTGNAVTNVLVGNSAANRLEGGGADDLYVVDGADAIVERAGEGRDWAVALTSYTLDAEVEVLILYGSLALDGTGNALDNVLVGTHGANRLDGGLGADTLIGGAGNDTYVLSGAEDVVVEGAGAGIDTIEVATSWTLGANLENLRLAGLDAISGTGNALDNVIIGNDAANSLAGGDGNDRLDGGAGGDTMTGGAGDDVFVYDHLSDRAYDSSAAGGGTDTVLSAVTATLTTYVENLTLTGSANITGVGNALDNAIVGNAGNNVLNGGAGADRLSGGGGDDRFLFLDAAHSLTTAFDQILDFHAGDRIDISRIDADPSDTDNDAFAFVGDAAFSHTAGELRAVRSGSDWLVEGDRDGNGVADFAILVTTSAEHLLGAGDFLL